MGYDDLLKFTSNDFDGDVEQFYAPQSETVRLELYEDKIDKLQRRIDSLIEKIEFAPVDGAPEFEKAKKDWNERNKN